MNQLRNKITATVVTCLSFFSFLFYGLDASFSILISPFSLPKAPKLHFPPVVALWGTARQYVRLNLCYLTARAKRQTEGTYAYCFVLVLLRNKQRWRGTDGDEEGQPGMRWDNLTVAWDKHKRRRTDWELCGRGRDEGMRYERR